MPEVRKIVDCGAAEIHRDFSRGEGLERFFFAGEGVVSLEGHEEKLKRRETINELENQGIENIKTDQGDDWRKIKHAGAGHDFTQRAKNGLRDPNRELIDGVGRVGAKP